MIRRDFRPFLPDHIEKKKVGQPLNIIAAIDTVVPQDMTESPEFSNNIGHVSSYLTGFTGLTGYILIRKLPGQFLDAVFLLACLE